MNRILSFIYDHITVAIIGCGVLLFAGEIKLAVAKKAKKGSTKLSLLTQKMTSLKMSFVMKVRNLSFSFLLYF